MKKFYEVPKNQYCNTNNYQMNIRAVFNKVHIYPSKSTSITIVMYRNRKLCTMFKIINKYIVVM